MATPRQASGRVAADAVITARAARQHGVVTRAQLLRDGLTHDVVDGRIARGLLQPLHRGVFRVGPVIDPLAPALAACFACGRAAWVGERSAAVLWELLPAASVRGDVDIIVRGGYHRRDGIRLHRVTGLRADEVTQLQGIPITRPARTLLDLSAKASPRELERAVAAALAHRLTTFAALRRMLQRWPQRHGTAALRACIEARPALTRSEAEERFLAAVRHGGLREPETNVRIEGCEVDFLWRDARLIVEIDGFAWHATPAAFENDRRRDLLLTSRGMRVVRVTWKQLTRAPDAVIARVAQALSWRP